MAPPDLVPHVPGYGTPKAPIYAGTVPVDAPSRGVQLFYIFTSMLSAATPSTPIILWLQGGGGASPPWGKQTGPFALDGYAGGGPSTFGMLCEKIGPFSNPDNSTGRWVLKDNPLTWNNHAHLLFIDQHAGVGFSSFSVTQNGYAANGTMLGHDVAAGLVGFFARHPELASNPLYIFGESCAHRRGRARALAWRARDSAAAHASTHHCWQMRATTSRTLRPTSSSTARNPSTRAYASASRAWALATSARARSTRCHCPR